MWTVVGDLINRESPKLNEIRRERPFDTLVLVTSGICRRKVIKSGSLAWSVAMNILMKSSRSIASIDTSVWQHTVAVRLCALINATSCRSKRKWRGRERDRAGENRKNDYSNDDEYYSNRRKTLLRQTSCLSSVQLPVGNWMSCWTDFDGVYTHRLGKWSPMRNKVTIACLLIPSTIK